MTQNGTKWPQMALKHFRWEYYMILCHVGPPWALFRGPLGPHNGPKQHQIWSFMTKMALHDPKCPCMTPNGPKTLTMGILHDIMLCWTTLGPIQRSIGAPKWPKTAPKWPFITQNGPLRPKMMLQWRAFMTQNVPLWPKMYLHDLKWP